MERQDIEINILKKALEMAEEELSKQKEKSNKKLKGNINRSFTHLDYLKSMTKDELDNIRKMLEISGVSKLKKDELSKVLVDNIKLRIRDLLEKKVTLKEYKLISRIVHQGGILAYDDIFKEEALFLRSLGIVFSGKDEYKELIMLIPKELLGDIRVLLTDSSLGEAIEKKDKLLRITRGLLYYYGVMNSRNLYERVYKLSNSNLNYDEYISILMDYCENKNHIKQKEELFYNQYLMYPKEIKEKQDKRSDVDYYPITLIEAFEAGEENYFDWNEDVENFYTLLKASPKLKSVDEKELVIKSIQLIKNDFSLTQILSYFSHYVGFTSMEIANNFLQCIQKLDNNSRLWVLKGNTSQELLKSRKELINYKAEPMKPIKIGRNEPCPCGSGKKYKKCCGAN